MLWQLLQRLSMQRRPKHYHLMDLARPNQLEEPSPILRLEIPPLLTPIPEIWAETDFICRQTATP